MLSSLQDISILRQWASDLIYHNKNYPVQLPGAAPCCGYSSSAVIHPAAEPADSAHRLTALIHNLYLGGGFSESQAAASHPGSNQCSCERAGAEKTPQSVTFLPIDLGKEVFAGQWQQSQPCEGGRWEDRRLWDSPTEIWWANSCFAYFKEWTIEHAHFY